jgi:nucleoside-diphosphate-sugar epimerase
MTVDFKGARAVVTGANGFIGRSLVAGLLRANAKVTVLLRSGHGKGHFRACGAEVVICPLVEGPGLETALQGHDMLFHFAYDVRASGADNLAAFSALYGAAARSGITRIIHASSIVVYDDWPNGQISENSPVSTNSGGDYRQAKIAMENALLSGNMAAAILQPTIVYGPGSALWSAAPQAALRKGPVVLPDPPGICPAVFVEDVVSAALLAGALPDLGKERFIVTGPDTRTWADFYRGHAKHIQTGSIKLVPVAELRARVPPPVHTGEQKGPSMAARISTVLRRLIGSRRFEWVMSALRARLSGSGSGPGSGPIYPAPHMLDLYAADVSVSSDYACSRLGYQPEFDMTTGLSTVATSD